jgi:Protein of unknown function (DUF3105)
MRRHRALIVLAVASAAALSACVAVAGLVPRDTTSRGEDPNSLRALSEDAGCRLIEIYDARHTNPPTSGDFSERDRVRDGDYSRADRPPALRSVLHALEHGRVLFQYRRGLATDKLHLLRAVLAKHPRKTLLFQNQTGMRYEVAAVAYLSAVVCPRFSERAVPVLEAFRERRLEFGQGQ